ncbi:MAG: mechanosensitive ion channel [Ktedonobacteraceae bacterium]|nr:mechanosensitive ion channel [Ktedonobacteraceae bacterium]
MIDHIPYIVLTALLAVVIGLFARRLLVRRLKNTVVDAWLVQTLGIIAVIIPLAVAVPITVAIWDSNLPATILHQLNLSFTLTGGTDFVLHFTGSLLIAVLAIGIGRTLRRMTIHGLGEKRIDVNIRTLIGHVLYIVILAVAAFWILSLWQVAVGIPIAILSTFTIALTLSLQDILKDLVAGLYILMERPFHIGDEICIENRTGRVEDVQIRATTLRLNSGEEVIIPNTQVFSAIVVNNTFYGERRATITLTLPQEEFVKDETAARIIGILKEIETVMPKPEPGVVLSGYTGKLLTLTLHFWIASGQSDTLSQAMYNLRNAFPNADLAVAEAAGAV